ncbi:MAG: RNA polymerase sigma factor [Deltaproteobacteria bacterium]|nr:RNA polymerase sigma factor [Deltaproteobacteria bacterium]
MEQTVPRHPEVLALTEAVSLGDRKAARQLVSRLYDRARATVFYLAGTHRDADDLVQLAMMEVIRSAGSYRGEASVEKWADRIVVRTAMRHIKQRRRRDHVVELDSERTFGAPAEQGDVVARRQLRQRITALLDRLPLRQKVVVTLHWMSGYRVAEIAEMVDAPVNTVRDRLQTAKRRLKKMALGDPMLRQWAERMHDEI